MPRKSSKAEKVKKYKEIQQNIFEFFKENDLHNLMAEMMYEAYSSSRDDEPLRIMINYLLEKGHKNIANNTLDHMRNLEEELRQARRSYEHLLREVSKCKCSDETFNEAEPQKLQVQSQNNLCEPSTSAGLLGTSEFISVPRLLDSDTEDNAEMNVETANTENLHEFTVPLTPADKNVVVELNSGNDEKTEKFVASEKNSGNEEKTEDTSVQLPPAVLSDDIASIKFEKSKEILNVAVDVSQDLLVSDSESEKMVIDEKCESSDVEMKEASK